MPQPLSILFHRPTPWDDAVECSTKVLTRELDRRGARTAYLEAPADPINFVRPNRGRRYLARAPRVDNGTMVLRPFSAVPTRDVWPLNTLEATAARYSWIRRNLTAQVKAHFSGAPDLIWTTVPGAVKPLRRAFPDSLVCSHVIDYYPAFRGDAVRRLEQSDYRSADLVFVISNTLSDYVINELGVDPVKVVMLGQGVSVARFEQASEDPLSTQHLPRPRAIYVGVLAKCDAELMTVAAEKLKELGGSLTLAGPPSPWVKSLEDEHRATVRVLPAQPPDEIPALLTHADIGLMLYDRSKQDVYRGQNPLKLYEYAASGLDIISTPHDEFRTLKPPIRLVNNPESLERALDAATRSNRPNVAELRAFAERHDWRLIISSIGRSLERIGFKNWP
ncbi:hypothetical protein N9Z54_05985 [Planctomycetota bacterium]|nr:hypothetical protein [Planctomycetota bacterium]